MHSQGRLPPVQTRARQDVLGLRGSPALDLCAPSPRHVQTNRPITASPRPALRPLRGLLRTHKMRKTHDSDLQCALTRSGLDFTCTCSSTHSGGLPGIQYHPFSLRHAWLYS